VAVPKRGVYAVTAGRSAGESIPGVANVGVRPTFDGRDETVEAHLLGFKGDLYGETLRVRFVDRIRDERKFENVDQLVEQIRRDIEAARQILVGGTGNG
jgi:riboflavin kinase/FMN adenylyltransferase